MIGLLQVAVDTGTSTVEVYAPPIMGVAIGIPILAVLVWFFIQFSVREPPRMDYEE
jgi:hypothetical protein